MDVKREEYLLSDNKALIDIDVVYNMLSKSYWAGNRTKEIIKKSIHNSICFGIYLKRKQIGFARVVTDESTFSWLCDVIIHEDYRGKGLGKWMVEHVVNNEKIKDTLQLLATKDAHGLYRRVGFESKECMFKKRAK